MPQNNKKVTIFGYFGFKNLGDELILLSLVQNLKNRADITVLSKRPRETAGELGVRAVNRWNPFSAARQILASKTVLGGGGGLFQNKTSTLSLFYYLSLIVLAKIFSKRVVLLSQGIGPIHGRTARAVSRRILELADVITVRDRGSYEALKALGVKKEARVTGDAVFALDFSPSGIKKSGGPAAAGIALRSFREHRRFTGELREVLEQFRQGRKLSYIFYPFQVPEDNISGEDNRIISRPEELIREFAALDLVVGARYHSLVLARALQKPFIGINVDTKIKYLCESSGMPCLELNENTFKNNLKSSIIKLLNEKTPVIPEAYGQKVKESFSLVFDG